MRPLPRCTLRPRDFYGRTPGHGGSTGAAAHVDKTRLFAGAGFVVAICGDIMTMPGLPKKPAAETIDIDAEGRVSGLF